MIVTSLFAMNELTNSVSSSVNALLLDPGEQLIRPFNIPDSASWNQIRIFWKETIVGSNFSESITGFKWFSGFCSTNRGYKFAGSAHCIGFAVVADPSASGSVTLGRITTGNSIPTGSTIAWQGTLWPETVITGSFIGASGTTCFFPRYDTTYSSSHTSASLVGYPWKCNALEVTKGGTNIYTCSMMVWREVVTNTATGSQFNIPSSVFREGIQTISIRPYSLTSTSTPGIVWTKWFVDNTMSINMNSTIVGTVRNMLETTLGSLNNVNFYFTCSNANVKLAIRDIHVVKIR